MGKTDNNLYFHLHSTVNIQPFSPAFPLAEFMAEAFYWLFPCSFKEKGINHFLYDTAYSKSGQHFVQGGLSGMEQCGCEGGRFLLQAADMCAKHFF